MEKDKRVIAVGNSRSLEDEKGNQTLIPYRKGDLWGLSDKNKNVIVPCLYDKTYCFSEGLARFEKNGKWGFLDETGREIVANIYSYVYPLSNGYAIVIKDSQKGCINKNGEEFISCIYSRIERFEYFGTNWYGLLLVEKNHYYKGLIDIKGNEILPCIYKGIFLSSDNDEDIHVINEDVHWMGYPNYRGVFDKKGNEIIPFQYSSISERKHGLFIARKNKTGVIDKDGNEIIPFIYDGVDIEIISNFLLKFEIGSYHNKKYSFFHKKDGRFIAMDYNYISYFNKNLFLVKKNGKYGFCDKLGTERISCIYDNVIGKGLQGFIVVEKKGKWGYIDELGNEIIPCSFEGVYPFVEGISAVKMNNTWKLIDENRNFISHIKDYIFVEFFSEDLLITTNNREHGLIDRNGIEVIPCEYREIEVLFDKFFKLFNIELVAGYESRNKP